MRTYIIRRLLLLIPTLILATMLVFLVVRLLPGDFVTKMMTQFGGGLKQATNLQLDTIRERLGLTRPIHIQYVSWISGIVRGDFGESLWEGKDVLEDILEKIPVSLELGILAMLTANILGLSVGAYAAIRQDTFLDYAGRGFAIIFLSAPAFWIATLMILFGSIWFGWVPVLGYVPLWENPIENLKQMIIPSVLLGLGMSGWVVRFLRTTMLDVMRQDYVRTAWAKGMRERVVMVRHVMRNAMIPVVTIIAQQLGLIVGGTVIIEQIFNLPGMGRLFILAAFQRDYPYISGINLLAGTFTLFVILITDLSYAYLDPRIRYR